jgi:hypothetical protein
MLIFNPQSSPRTAEHGQNGPIREPALDRQELRGQRESRAGEYDPRWHRQEARRGCGGQEEEEEEEGKWAAGVQEEAQREQARSRSAR